MAVLPIFVALAACVAPADPQAQALCSGRPAKSYFPAGVFDPVADADRFKAEWYAKHLKAMEEPSLLCASRYPVYRFLWLRTLDRPIAVRVEQRPDGAHMTAVELDGAGGYEPGDVSKRVARTLSADEARMFARALTVADVWAPPDTPGSVGLDGSRWIVEARAGERYRLHDVWTPESGRVRALGMVFLETSGWRIPQEDIY